VFAVLGAWLLGGLIGGAATAVLDLGPLRDPLGLAITVMGQSGAALAMVWRISMKSGNGSLRQDVGLALRGRDTIGILMGVGLQFAVALLMAPFIEIFFSDVDAQQQVADVAESTSDAGGRLVLVVLFVVVAPFIEEVIFRGAMLSWLARKMSIRLAVVVQAAAFALVHLIDPDAILAVVSLFLLGIALGWAAQRRGSLSLPIFLHAGVNLTAVVVLFWGDEIVDRLEEAPEGVAALGRLFGLS